MKKTLGIFTLLLGILLAPKLTPAQCPMCKAAVTTSSNYGAKENKMVAGLNAGILYLFLLPYGSLMLVGFVVVLNYRRNQKLQSQELSDTTVDDLLGGHVPGSRPAAE